MSPELSRPSTALSRRTLLGGAAAAAVLSALPLSVRQALAAPARPGRLEDIQHVVVLMQENRAFDHYFGTLPGVRGFGDRAAVRGVNGRSVFHQPDPSRPEGYLLPYPMNAAHTSAYQQGAPAFGYVDSMNAWNDGLADGSVTRRSSGWLGQGYYESADMPFYHALASVFTTCDAYYASVQCNTNTNREHLMTGTSGGTVRDTPVTDNSEPAAGFEWTTYAERLERAGVSWRTYQALDNFDDNALAWFTSFIQAKPGSALYERGLRAVGDPAKKGDPFAMGDALVEAFANDVRDDRLPQVSWLVAPAALSEHANYAPPNGEHLTARLLAALAANPEVWAKTVFILNYDEHGGFFDHQLPPVPPLAAGRGASTVPVDGEVVVRVGKGGSTYHRVVGQDGRYRVRNADGSLGWSATLPAGETLVSGPYPMGLGVRVPMVVVSPWTRGGVVDSTVYDHTSVIRLLERRFGVAEPNISPWRRAVTGDLTDVFDFSGQDPAWPELPDTSGNRQKVTDTGKLPAPTVPKPQAAPQQQRGTRTARPVPYHLQVKARVRKGVLTLDLANPGRQGAVIAAYPEPGSAPRHYTVGVKGKLSDTWQLGPDGYDLRLHGPNGALWHLRGDVTGSYETSVSEDGGGGWQLAVEVANRTPVSRVMTIGDLAYGGGQREVRLGSGESAVVNLPVGKEGWYDVVVTARDDARYRFRRAGRLPHQAVGSTDPAMGLADPLLLDVALGSASATVDEAVLLPGRPARLKARLTATADLTALELAPLLPAGWPAPTVVTAPPAALAAGASADAEWEVRVPAAPAATSRLLVTARGTAADRYAVADGEVAARTAPSMAGYLLGEDFESLAPALVPVSGVLGWTAQAPAGWSVVNAPGMPQGTARLQGWTFHTKRAWSTPAGQDRGNFTRGLGVLAVADPDDWDDTGSPSAKGRFDSTLVSPAVPVPPGTDSLYLAFDSHYRQEAPQKASVTAVFDTGEEARLLFYSSDATGNDNAGQDAENAFVTRRFAVPAGARTVTLKFRMYDAGNNWYWAVDHVRLDVRPITG
ncbi:phosphocholine-specific phospholipase C [Kitasatospora fiedleri]|uniref:phosphocholine-specific phospholipase C n=1 Tax=Kitasatospora fiedleri TaxID=2991545 RepID=UPI00249C9961|nr:phospholipase C, phosphocholine-specific [Kitasatospora fiedleri]